MKGKFHLPVIAFAIGGGMVRLSTIEQVFLLVLCIAWLTLFRKHVYWMIILSIALISGYIYLEPPSPPSNLSSTFSSSVSIQHVKTKTDYVEMIVSQTDESEKTLVSFFPKDTEYAPSSWKHGARCAIEGEKTAIEGPTNPGQFDFQKYMAQKGVYSQIVIDDLSQMECEGGSWWSLMYDVRETIIRKVEAAVDPKAFPWISALVFGEQDILEGHTIEWFRDFNLSHILAISGLHIGLFIAGLYIIIIRSGVGTVEQAQKMVFLILPFYAFLAGSAPSVLRATVMAMLLLFMTFLKRNTPITDILSIAALLLLLFSPTTFSQIGFQFSFLVTFCLVLSINIIARSDSIWGQSAQISLISQLSILPLQIHYFYEFNPLSLLANLLLVPYFSFFVIPICFLIVLLSMVFPSVSLGFSKYLAEGHESILSLIQKLAAPFRMSWIVGEISPFLIILLFLSFLFMMTQWGREKRKLACLGGGLFVALLTAWSIMPYLSPKGTVTMLDIGQGDTFVIELPFRKGVILIDAAGPPPFIEDTTKTADQVIIPFLKSKGIGSIDAIIITHEDTDHNGSVEPLMKTLKVEGLVVHPYYPAKETGVAVVKARRGDNLKIKGQPFAILHPMEEADNPNDNSIVLMTELGGENWLFTGDISIEVESDLIEAYPSLQADILKVGHHGSHTSTSESWIEQLNPRFALISAGRNNRYGHPHQEVLGRLQEHEVTIYQTSQDGAVIFTFSGESGTFSTFLPYNASR